MNNIAVARVTKDTINASWVATPSRPHLTMAAIEAEGQEQSRASFCWARKDAYDSLTIETPLFTAKLPVKVASLVSLEWVTAPFRPLATPSFCSVAVSTGEVFIVDHNGEAASVEVAAIVTGGIAAFSWSPDGTTAAFISRLGRAGVLVPSSSSSTDAFAISFSPNQPEITMAPCSSNVSLSWREDSAFFSACLSDGFVLIFEKLGCRWSTSCHDSAVAPMDHGKPIHQKFTDTPVQLAWKPSGDLIAVATLSSKLNFHDRAGYLKFTADLHHQPLTASTARVMSLCWNSSSSILAVVLMVESLIEVQLWSTANYKWYRKQSIRFPFTGVPSVAASFDLEDPLLLRVACGDSLHTVFVAERYSVGPEPLCCAAVVDGRSLCLTYLGQAIIPPPMSHHILSFDDDISSVCFSASSVVVQLTNHQLLQYSLTSSSPVLINSSKFLMQLFSMTVVDETTLIGFNGSSLYHITLTSSPLMVQQYSVANGVVGIAPSKSKQTVLLQHATSSISSYNCSTHEITPFGSLPRPCSVFGVVVGGDENTAAVLYGFDEANHQLFVGGHTIATNCSSLVNHPDFLVFSCLDNKLRFLPITANLQQQPPQQQLEERDVERGSLILAVIGSSVVLQIPRGNLETISPRPLVMKQVIRMLDKSDYLSAMQVVRRQRLDMNVIVDHNKPKFMADLRLFVTSVARVDWLNVFISSLSDTNIASLCTPLRQAFEAVDRKQFMLPIITCLAVDQPPKLEAALSLINSLRSVSAASEEFNEAMDYLLFLCDVNKLYDVALGMYDLDLVRMVGDRSQKDPKEYMPFITQLAEMKSEPMRRYLIDTTLARWPRALQDLLDAEDHFSEFVEVMEKHTLYQDALMMLTSKQIAEQAKKVDVVVEKYAEYLTSHLGRNEQAAILMASCGKYERAAELFSECLDWKQAISCLLMAPAGGNSAEQQKEFLRDLAQRLEDAEQFSDAAQVHETHLQDPKKALTALVSGRMWIEAELLWVSVKDEGETKTVLKERFIKEVDEAVMKYTNDIKEQTEALGTLNQEAAQCLRTLSSRLPPQASRAPRRPEDDETASRVSKKSAATTTATGATSSRSTTARARRPSPAEKCLANVASSLPSDSFQTEVGALLKVLLHRHQPGHFTAALTLQKEMAQLTVLAKSLLSAGSPVHTLLESLPAQDPVPVWVSILQSWKEKSWSITSLLSVD